MRGERGSGTVLVAGIVAVACVLTVLVAAYSGIAAARARTQAAADFAALAAAQSIGSDPCGKAAEAAAWAGATVTACTDEGLDVTVTLTRPVLAAGYWRLEASARAGPADLP